MFEAQQNVHVYIPDSVNGNAVILERIERDYGVVYSVQLDGSDETMIVNEYQLMA
ncbi:hypothetical protein IAH99_14115 [Vibrio cholerae]|uniref:hypothetical protein n=1 Tax=Vibrio cholerae TaxID=666 RepID=UPI001657E8C7|nr:hypothetical protein [Vibrio cholerae]MBC9069481.1 hypothetical protein [Vibrio cholerae]